MSTEDHAIFRVWSCHEKSYTSKYIYIYYKSPKWRTAECIDETFHLGKWNTSGCETYGVKEPPANKHGNGKSAIHIHFWLIFLYICHVWFPEGIYLKEWNAPAGISGQPVKEWAQRLPEPVSWGAVVMGTPGEPNRSTILDHRHHAQVCEPTFQLNMFNHQSILIPISLNFRSIASLFARVIHKLLKSNWGLWNWVYHCIWDDLS